MAARLTDKLMGINDIVSLIDAREEYLRGAKYRAKYELAAEVQKRLSE